MAKVRLYITTEGKVSAAEFRVQHDIEEYVVLKWDHDRIFVELSHHSNPVPESLEKLVGEVTSYETLFFDVPFYGREPGQYAIGGIFDKPVVAEAELLRETANSYTLFIRAKNLAMLLELREAILTGTITPWKSYMTRQERG